VRLKSWLFIRKTLLLATIFLVVVVAMALLVAPENPRTAVFMVAALSASTHATITHAFWVVSRQDGVWESEEVVSRAWSSAREAGEKEN
jgi:disulfide bond formation protein DsbB